MPSTHENDFVQGVYICHSSRSLFVSVLVSAKKKGIKLSCKRSFASELLRCVKLNQASTLEQRKENSNLLFSAFFSVGRMKKTPHTFKILIYPPHQPLKTLSTPRGKKKEDKWVPRNLPQSNKNVPNIISLFCHRGAFGRSQTDIKQVSSNGAAALQARLCNARLPKRGRLQRIELPLE